MYDIFGCTSDFAHDFRHLMPTTLNCGATSIFRLTKNAELGTKKAEPHQ